MKTLLSASFALAGAVLAAAPLNPEIVKKDVKIVRRTVMVSVIGEGLMNLKPGETPDVQKMIQYWTDGMDKEVGNHPDLIVLPEICDMYTGLEDAEAKHRWIAQRGDQVLTAFRAYAKKHHSYIVYPTYCQLGNRRYHNCSYLIDRDGDVVARYDKVYPTVGDIAWGVIPGKAPVVVDTDFGRMGFAICFDLNFWDLLDRYAALKPDVMVFSSYYHGDFMQQVWAYKCRSHLIASTVGNLPKDVVTPCGMFQRMERDYFRTFSEKINTNCTVVHLDFNWKKLDAAVAKYGRKVRVGTSGRVGAVVLYSEDPAVPVADIIKEFDIELWWDGYYVRSQNACRDALEKAKNQ